MQFYIQVPYTHDNKGPLILDYHLLSISIDAYILFHLKY